MIIVATNVKIGFLRTILPILPYNIPSSALVLDDFFGMKGQNDFAPNIVRIAGTKVKEANVIITIAIPIIGPID